MAWQPQERIEEPLDFTKILHRQIWSIMQAKNDNDVNKYIRSVENFEDLLISKTEGDTVYDEDIVSAKAKFAKRKERLSVTNRQDLAKINRAREIFSRDAFRALIKLIDRAGFLPRKEIEGVISKYDGLLVEKLMELEKAGIKEVEVEEEVEVDETDADD